MGEKTVTLLLFFIKQFYDYTTNNIDIKAQGLANTG